MGNTNKRYSSLLVKARPTVEKVYERVVCFKLEVDRSRVTAEDKESIMKVIEDGRTALQEVLDAPATNIPATEREAVRGIKAQISALKDSVEAYELEQDAEEDRSAASTRILVRRVGDTLENLREFLRWVDQKVEKQWWLKLTIKYAKLLVLVATFLSATLAVAFPELSAEIVTLTLTAISGVLDIVKKAFIKGGPKVDSTTLLQSSAQRISPSV